MIWVVVWWVVLPILIVTEHLHATKVETVDNQAVSFIGYECRDDVGGG